MSETSSALSFRRRLFFSVLLSLLAVAPSVRGEMELVFREMFATTGQLDEANPGTNFSAVQRTLQQRAGGPRLVGTAAASAVLKGEIPPPFGAVQLTEAGNRLFVCGWFFFKSLQNQSARVLTIHSDVVEPGPCITLEGGLIGGGTAYGGRTVLPESITNRWIFLGVAVSRDSPFSGSLRCYYKFPGQPMQTWGGFDDENIGIPEVGGASFGVEASNSAIHCRMGAPAAYRFENADFSDIVYPPDLLEPETRLTWYCNPATGSDNNDGTAPDRAWASLSKLNEESRHAGMLSADTVEEGDTLIVDTSGAPLDGEGESWVIQTSGLSVRAAQGNEWITVKSHRSLSPGDWEPSGIPKVYSTTDTQEDIVLWEEDKFLNHPTGSNLAAVSAFLSATPGSFWTDGVRLYLHPFGSTDPRGDGKRYERSRVMSEGSAVVLKAPNLSIEDLHVGKTCLSRSYDGDSIGAYCLGNNGPMGRTRIAHCYLYYGSKHNIGLTTGGPGDDVLVEDVQCEQGSPYGGPGGQTVFVSFNHQPLPLGIIHRYHRCKTIANAGLIGSSQGEMTSLFPVFYAHNIGGPAQFALFEFIDCDFGNGPVFGAAVEQVTMEGCTFGDFSFDADVEIDRCRIQGPVSGPPGYRLSIRNSLLKRSGMLTATSVSGELVVEGCHLDGSGITSIQGGVPQAAFFTRSGPIDVVFRNNAVVLPDAALGANVFSLLQHTDGLDFASNAYRLGGNQLVYQYDTGSGIQTPTLSQWQALGKDAGSFPLPDLILTETPPGLGSPLLDAGEELTTSSDFTGQSLLRRNDIGAFEGPPTRFDEWQHLHFDESEILAEESGGPEGSLFDDGVPNLMKYALGLPARDHAPAGLFPFTSPDAADSFFEFTRSRLPGDLEWGLERSSDLQVWTEVSNPALQILSTGTTTESLRMTLPPDTGTRFFRVKVRTTAP
jgi:hypothetical protein